MRNWNRVVKHTSNDVGFSFYSTYEELKQSKRPTVELERSRFYSTYEELKQTSANIKIYLLRSFYSTYEELKQEVWNVFKKFLFMFLQYLWGIETIRPQRICP